MDTKRLASPAALSEAELGRTLARIPETVTHLARTIEQNPRSTIEPDRARSSSANERALADLLEAMQGRESTPPRGIGAGLALGATIGEGGMGLVRQATQRSLGRTVAVKTLRSGVVGSAEGRSATLRLLREAWVTGSLEHPNIVPIHDLGLGEDGAPVIVLKRIEGVAWSVVIGDAAAAKAKYGAHDLLEHNLRILVQLCNAVSLAHARGILHRDLKPENVMIGNFGEVYLVDWGIAVSLRQDPSGRLPVVGDAPEMAGTPAYMAPEMLGAIGKLDERTDVYLLGAILHEVLTGDPPHVGESFRAIMASILVSHFSFPESAPPELVAIATRAMSRQAEDRFASADELRLSLEGYLRHRGSLALSAEASGRVEEMRQVLVTRLDSEDARERVHHLFAEARFGFRQAIRACEDNVTARDRLREVTEMVVAFELDQGQPEVAAATLAELEEPPPELARAVAEALREREAERRRVASLEELSADLDPATGRRTRLAATIIMALVWSLSPEVCGLFVRRHAGFPYEWFYGVTATIAAIGGLVLLWGRDSLGKTAVNRRTQALVMLMFATQLTTQVGGRSLGLTLSTIVVLHLLGWFFSSAVFALFVDRRFWSCVAGYLAAFLVACEVPAVVWHVMALANLVMCANALVAWAQPRSDSQFLVARVRERKERILSGARR